jgi:hypothetical protein
VPYRGLHRTRRWRRLRVAYHRSAYYGSATWKTLTGRRLRPLLKDWQIGALMVPFALAAGVALGYGAHQLIDLMTTPHPVHCVSVGLARCPPR